MFADVVATRLLFVDDDRRFCAMAGLLLDGELEVTFAHTACAAVRAATAARPHVAIVDLSLPDGDGIDLIAALSRQQPDLSILVLTIASAEIRILAALRAGARGYLFKEDVARLRRSVDEVLAGESPMSPGVARLVLLQLRGQTSAIPGIEPRGTLTARELEVVDRLRRGDSYEEVGLSLGVSTNTVRTYIRSVYEKLEVSSKTEAVLEALRRGWLR
jgi:DNA-binding NarL/FixJ family response regulator